MDKSTLEHAKRFVASMESKIDVSLEDMQRALFYIDEAVKEIERLWENRESELENSLT